MRHPDDIFPPVVQALRAYVHRYTLPVVADEFAITPEYLEKLVVARRPMPIWIAAKFGFSLAVMWVPTDQVTPDMQILTRYSFRKEQLRVKKHK